MQRPKNKNHNPQSLPKGNRAYTETGYNQMTGALKQILFQGISRQDIRNGETRLNKSIPF